MAAVRQFCYNNIKNRDDVLQALMMCVKEGKCNIDDIDLKPKGMYFPS